MFGVCISHPEKDPWLNQWEYLFTHFAPDNIWILGAPDDAKYHAKVERIVSVSELPAAPIVLMAAPQSRYVQGQQSLEGFQHPDDAIYLFGSDSTNISQENFRQRTPDKIVFVPTVTHHEMFSWIAGAITFYDRMVKLGKPNHR